MRQRDQCKQCPSCRTCLNGWAWREPKCFNCGAPLRSEPFDGAKPGGDAGGVRSSVLVGQPPASERSEPKDETHQGDGPGAVSFHGGTICAGAQKPAQAGGCSNGPDQR